MGNLPPFRAPARLWYIRLNAMGLRKHTLDAKLGTLIKAIDGLRGHGAPYDAARRWQADAQALRFHLQFLLREQGAGAKLIAVIGGTGTGKSTLVNRLLGQEVTATSFRRTHTSGPVAIAGEAGALPGEWLGVPHLTAGGEALPARGEAESLVVVQARSALTQKVTLIDTPDLDGDQPHHHAQADRVFRWAQAVLFAVTPEKYQMTELMPYYRLALRYRVPALFVMNKSEEQAVIDDYVKQLAERGFGEGSAGLPLSRAVFAVPRDEAGFEPAPEVGLAALRAALGDLPALTAQARETGLANRAMDLLGRLGDQVVEPLRQERAEARRLLVSLVSLETPEPGVDVNPLTRSLQRRFQQRSILYLMGPGRMLDRVRQVPGLLARLPRGVWDVVVRGQKVNLSLTEDQDPARSELPDFRSALEEQFAIVQSRIDDNLRSTPAAQHWIDADASAYNARRLEVNEAGKIADEELAALRDWLEKRWNATPRDTAMLLRLLRFLPGGAKLANWTESAPYLLVLIVLVTHHALFGGFDLAIFGGWSLATWISEKLSNEVTNHTRATNRKIAQRFTELAHTQIVRVCEWLERQSPPQDLLDEVEKQADELSEMLDAQDERVDQEGGIHHEGTKPQRELE